MNAKEPLQRPRHIFSHDHSQDLWKAVKKVKSDKIHDALYTMGCYCQELEAVVHRLEERIAKLEDK